MKQEVICQQGKCFETESLDSEFDEMFDDTNMVDTIQRDMLKRMMSSQ